jgi:hypothetical protein
MWMPARHPRCGAAQETERGVGRLRAAARARRVPSPARRTDGAQLYRRRRHRRDAPMPADL